MRYLLVAISYKVNWLWHHVYKWHGELWNTVQSSSKTFCSTTWFYRSKDDVTYYLVKIWENVTCQFKYNNSKIKSLEWAIMFQFLKKCFHCADCGLHLFGPNHSSPHRPSHKIQYACLQRNLLDSTVILEEVILSLC